MYDKSDIYYQGIGSHLDSYCYNSLRSQIVILNDFSSEYGSYIK